MRHQDTTSPDIRARDTQRREVFPALDTLRLVGALFVLTTHVAFSVGAYLGNGVWGTLLSRLDVGVAVFFVLSGFLLSRPWLISAATGTDRPATSGYLRRRWWRIAPLYVVTVLLSLVLIEENRGLSWGDRIGTLAMLQTVRSDSFPAGLTHMWSLAVEVAFYLALPLLMALLLGRPGGRGRWSDHRLWAVLGLLVAISAWWQLSGADVVGAAWGGFPQQWLPGHLTWFAAGIGLAQLQVMRACGRQLPAAGLLVERLARQPGACWALAASLLLASATPLAGPVIFAAPTPAQALTKHVLYALVAALVVLPSVLGGGDRYERAMAAPALRHLGWISYGIFCLHLPLLHLVMWSTGWPLFEGRGLQIWLLTVASSLIASELAYRVVERPALALGRGPSRILPSRLLRSRAKNGSETGGPADDDASATAASAGTQR